MINSNDIRRLNLGHYTMPASSRWARQKIVVCAYIVRHAKGLVLFDTGIGVGHPESESEFGPIHRRPLRSVLADLGLKVADVSAVANCHLHLDHCGNNPLFPATPIFVQKREMDALPSLDYVVPELIDFERAELAVHDGEAEIAAGLRLIPTPGHTPGHQSLLVDTSRGKVLLAGQAVDSASDFARAQYTLDLGLASRTENIQDLPGWLAEVRLLDVQQVLFAHDLLAVSLDY